MAGEMKLTVRLVELNGGGFVVLEETLEGDHVTFEAMQAVSSIDEACGAAQRRIRDWHQECRQLKAAQLEDESGGSIVAPRKWWRAVR